MWLEIFNDQNYEQHDAILSKAEQDTKNFSDKHN